MLPPASGFDYVAHHPLHIVDPVPAGCFNVSDTGSILRELNGGSVGGMANTKALGRYAVQCVTKRLARGAASVAQRRDLVTGESSLWLHNGGASLLR